MKKEARSLAEEDLLELEKFAELQFSLDELACLIQVIPEQFRAEYHRPGSILANAVNRGRLKQEATIRTAIFKAAQDGSSPAQAQALEMFKKREVDDAT